MHYSIRFMPAGLLAALVVCSLDSGSVQAQFIAPLKAPKVNSGGLSNQFGTFPGNPTPFAAGPSVIYGQPLQQPKPSNPMPSGPSQVGSPFNSNMGSPFNNPFNAGFNNPYNPGFNNPYNAGFNGGFNPNLLTAPNSPYNPLSPVNQILTGMYNDYLAFNGPGAVFNNPFLAYAYAPIVSQYGYYGNPWSPYPPPMGGYGVPMGYQFGPWLQNTPNNPWNQLNNNQFLQQGPFKANVGPDPANIFK
jgi:hypothetical protein